MVTPETTPLSTLCDQADKVLQEWLQYTVDWVTVALHQSVDKTKTRDDWTRLLLVRSGGAICWRVEAICEHVNILSWFSESGSALFPSIAALARVWLGRAPSNAFQERVFSTGGIVMSSLRTRTDNHRAEMQVVLKHNRKEIRRMEATTSDSSES
ncbi:Hypothetical protein PHPALM_17582 [Phytophthora palmivora]|uniref:HAT C-terminal dimerisation domain-containing protein n=1 Tax=Phytophthora palmivora TaxID=4796 RepID=A0A2P4XLV4_9STRA|nr:Hypothetical protein PHPALM_17582 [Phytophthora palmivora]